jgi:hypothetical protein
VVDGYERAGNGNDRPRSGASLSRMSWYEREAKRQTPSAVSRQSSPNSHFIAFVEHNPVVKMFDR